MKIALINSPYLDIYGPFKVSAKINFPLGLGYIAAVLRASRHQVILLDPDAEGKTAYQLLQGLREYQPDVVGISCLTPSFPNACEIAKLTKQLTKSKVVVGGAHVSALPEYTLEKHPEFDVVVLGEGESTILELCNAFSNDKSDLSSVEGIAFRDNSQVIKTNPKKFITNLDQLPFPARELVNLDRYSIHTHKSIGMKSASMISSRGCPAKCVFCASGLTMGKRFRMHSPEYVISEMEHLVKDYGIEFMLLQDDVFTMNMERAAKICDEMLTKNLSVKWACWSRVNTVNRELLTLMQRSGCVRISFGIETGDETILRTLKKGTTLEQARTTLKLCEELGLRTQGSFILGHFGDTKETIKNTVNYACELDMDIALFFTLIPFPGTEVFHNYYVKKAQESFDWKEYVATSSKNTLPICELSHDELQKYIKLAYFRFYSRPWQLMKILKKIRSFSELTGYLKSGWGLLRRLID